MLMIATFKHSTYLELALRSLEQNGISKEHLLVAPLQQPEEAATTQIASGGTSSVQQNGRSFVDKAFILATIFMLIGGIYGFVLPWGPIIWALFGIVAGGVIGFAWESLSSTKRPKKTTKSKSEVVVIIDCSTVDPVTIEAILWKNQALGIGKIQHQEKQ